MISHARIESMKVDTARGFLEGVTELKQAVPYKRYTSNVPHRRGMCTGRYPQKAAKEFLKVLLNAENNAKYKGLDSENLKITHVVTKTGHTFQRNQCQEHRAGRHPRTMKPSALK